MVLTFFDETTILKHECFFPMLSPPPNFPNTGGMVFLTLSLYFYLLVPSMLVIRHMRTHFLSGESDPFLSFYTSDVY